MTFSEAVKKIRKERFLSQEDFAKTIERLYNYMIEKVREIEEIKW